MPRNEPPKPLMRCLGEFVGHIWQGVTADTRTPQKTAPQQSTHKVEVGRTVEHETRETPAGTVTLRRTTIEEIELPPAPGLGNAPGSAPGPTGAPNPAGSSSENSAGDPQSAETAKGTGTAHNAGPDTSQQPPRNP